MQKNVLVIEDDGVLRKAYGAKFQLEGMQMVEADNGPEGVELAKRTKPDVILLDMLLGGAMNGIEVIELLKKDEATKDIPVMVLTNSSTPVTAERVLHLGAASYHVKAHVSMQDIIDEIKLLTA